jgi:two-component system response regulator YesN
MNLLIVDDEYYSVENLRNKLDWKSMDFDQAFCAYSMQQAQTVFADHVIDVLLCDIEMPHGSGLELLQWVREQNYKTECIFLTCFAKFDYAARALQLESSDYLLKPVEEAELRKAVCRAAERRRHKEAEQMNALHAEYWMDSRYQRTEQFWRALADGNMQSGQPTRESMEKRLEALHLPSEILQKSFVPVLLSCRRVQSTIDWAPELYEYAVKNILNEILSQEQEAPDIISLEKHQLLLLLCGDRTLIEPALEHCKKVCCATLPGIFRFYYTGTVCCAGDLTQAMRTLENRAHEDVSDQSKLCGPAEELAGELPSELSAIPAKKWTDLLLNRKIDEVHLEAVEYLHVLSQKPYASRQELAAFYHDFSQVLYSLLDQRGAPAHRLFPDATESQLTEHACDTAGNMEIWIGHILTAYREGLAETDESGSVVEEVRQYVRLHLAEDINRNTIAQAVFLSPDYLSHLFHEKTGNSLTALVAEERIRRAKELLAHREMSIRDIALASGFQNISYFSKQFKRATGQTPQEFRRKEGE